MSGIITHCPTCHNELQITSLKCNRCGLELHNDFEIGAFDRINGEQYNFLVTFLRCRGNMSSLQKEMNISYPSAQKKLNELLKALNISDETERREKEKIDMNEWNVDTSSPLPSEIIKSRLKEAGGKALVTSVNGKIYEIRAAADGKSFLCDDLPITPPLTYQVFDVIVNLLITCGGKARKGKGRNEKLGDPDCDDTTVVGVIGKNYFGKHNGESVLDPVFVLSAVLDWSGIVYNNRGYLELTENYKMRIR